MTVINPITTMIKKVHRFRISLLVTYFDTSILILGGAKVATVPKIIKSQIGVACGLSVNIISSYRLIMCRLINQYNKISFGLNILLYPEEKGAKDYKCQD